ncbi:hypothetical protein RF644_18120 [Kocuria sp. CPCC 205258]|uniref:hypothetical protein n=1 Tax=Kocuria sp. CPCC 205258 TaxID=3073552 RepID=UPI0034D53A67
MTETLFNLLPNSVWVVVAAVLVLLFIALERLAVFYSSYSTNRAEDRMLKTIELAASSVEKLDSSSEASKRLNRFLENELLDELEARREKTNMRRAKIKRVMDGPYGKPIKIALLSFLVVLPIVSVASYEIYVSSSLDFQEFLMIVSTAVFLSAMFSYFIFVIAMIILYINTKVNQKNTKKALVRDGVDGVGSYHI